MFWVLLLLAARGAHADRPQLGLRVGVHASGFLAFDDDAPGGAGPALELEGGRRSGRVSLTAFGTYLRFRDRDVLGINTDEIYDERVDVFGGGGRIARHVGMAVFGGGLGFQSVRRRGGEFDGWETTILLELIAGVEIDTGNPHYKVTLGGALTVGLVGNARAMLGFQWE